MSLMTYDEAFPWAESIRAELVAAHMPPWNADDGFGELKRAHTLSSKELDVIMTWASGGNPRGSLDQKLPEVTLKNDWTMGTPDLALRLPSEFTRRGRQDGGHAGVHARRPGSPRRAGCARSICCPARRRSCAARRSREGRRARPRGDAPRRITCSPRVPGQDPEPVDSGARSGCPPVPSSVARIHYKKTWQFEGKPLTDRSTVGVYFAKDAGPHAAGPVASGGVEEPPEHRVGDRVEQEHPVTGQLGSVVADLADSPGAPPDRRRRA